MCKIKKCADLLVEAHRVPGKLVTAWPEGMQPKTIEEGYKIAAEVDKALGLSFVGYKVVCTPRTRVSLLKHYEIYCINIFKYLEYL